MYNIGNRVSVKISKFLKPNKIIDGIILNIETVEFETWLGLEDEYNVYKIKLDNGKIIEIDEHFNTSTYKIISQLTERTT